MSQLQATGNNLLIAMISGSTASAVTATVTYPLDCLKTQQQLNYLARMQKFSIPGNYPGSLSQLMKGNSALVTGSILKSCARLMSYNWSSKFMAIDSRVEEGKLVQKTTAPRIVVAALISGTLESFWIIPFENIKIAMIQNMTLRNELERTKKQGVDITSSVSHQKQKPHNIFGRQYISPHAYWTSDVVAQYFGRIPSRFNPTHRPNKKDSLKSNFNRHPSLSFIGTIKEIYALKGVQGFFSGTFITMFRQVSISTVWFSSYNAARQLIDPHGSVEDDHVMGWNLHAIKTLGFHLTSSLAVVAITQPIDVVKTHRQSKNSKEVYKDALTTAYRLFVYRGFQSLFKGTFPRFIKVTVSSGLTAAVFTCIDNLAQSAGGQTLVTE